MSKNASLLQAALIVASLTSSAMAASLPGFTLTAETAHFSFYTRGAKVEAEKNEKFLASVEGTLGQKYKGHADYYRYERPEDIAATTGAYAAGVTYAEAGQIHSTQSYHAHEIVHLVAGQLGNPGEFFQEGLAVALGNEGRWNGADVDKLAKKAVAEVAVKDMLDRFASVDGQKTYPAAGSFVRSLIKKYGVAKVADFFRSCPRAQMRNIAFQQTFGVSLAQATTEWSEAL
jgi:hypothetical protein